MSVSPSRRRLLQTLLLAPVAAACSRSKHEQPATEDPDVALRAAATVREQALIAAYRSAATASSAVAAVLADHEEHLRVLGSASPTPSAAPAGAPVPAGRLAAQERQAAAAHAAAALDASPSLAALLASLAASEASHAVALT